MHRDPGLSLDVEEFESFATAEEYRDRLADFLDLPPSRRRQALAMPTTARRASAPRRGAAAASGAPAALPHPPALRQRNQPSSKIEGREIIARH